MLFSVSLGSCRNLWIGNRSPGYSESMSLVLGEEIAERSDWKSKVLGPTGPVDQYGKVDLSVDCESSEVSGQWLLVPACVGVRLVEILGVSMWRLLYRCPTSDLHGKNYVWHGPSIRVHRQPRLT
ncbi:unnamed protein product [Prunus armeniaca]